MPRQPHRLGRQPVEARAAAAAQRLPARGRDRAQPQHSGGASIGDDPAARTRDRWARHCDNPVTVEHPQTHWFADPAVLAPILLMVGIYVWRFREVRRETGGRGAEAWRRARLRRGGARPAGRARHPDRRARRGLPVLRAHGPARPARRHRAAAAAALALARDPPAGHAAAHARRARARPAREPAGRDRRLARHACTSGTSRRSTTPPPSTPLLHALEHVSFFAAGIALWWPLVQPIPMRRALTGLQPLGYIAAAKGGLAALGLFLAWSSTAHYPCYEDAPRIWGLSAVEDQNVAGVIMMVEQSLTLVLVMVWVFVRMLTRSEEERAEARAARRGSSSRVERRCDQHRVLTVGAPLPSSSCLEITPHRRSPHRRCPTLRATGRSSSSRASSRWSPRRRTSAPRATLPWSGPPRRSAPSSRRWCGATRSSPRSDFRGTRSSRPR